MSRRDRMFWEEQAVKEGIDHAVLSPKDRKEARRRVREEAMSALSDLKSTGLSVLTCERVETSQSCSECREAGGESGGMLLRFATRIGARERVHDGLFCSKSCHDRFHGLAARVDRLHKSGKALPHTGPDHGRYDE